MAVLKYAAQIEKIISLISPIFIPALIFSAALFGFYLYAPLTPAANLTFHTLFFIMAFACFMVLLYFNQRKPVFFILCALIAYILINVIKNKFGEEFWGEPAYQNLSVLLPLNLTIFYFWPGQRLLNRANIGLLLIVFCQYALGEQLSRSGINLNLWSSPSPLSGLALWLFGLAILAMFVQTVLTGSILDYALFFSTISICLGFFYSDSPTALTLLFGTAMFSLLTAIAQNLYFNTYRDSLTSLHSRNSYILHTRDFPLKYSIGIVSIDDFDKLRFRFGTHRQNQLIKLIAAKILEYEKPDCVYRYSNDEFVIVFKSYDKNESFERLETIRRAVASASFVFNPRRPALKVTVSAAVSEKKRSDANSFEVLVRARKVLDKTRSFSHNVTSKA